MAKQKKISLLIFHNKRVKPIINEEGKEEYPIYFRLVYDRKSTNFSPDWEQFKYNYQGDKPLKYYGYVDAELFDKIKKYYDDRKKYEKSELYSVVKMDSGEFFRIPETEFEENNKDRIIDDYVFMWSDLSNYEFIVKELVKFELELYKKEFSVKGFSKRLSNFYLQDILYLFGHFLSYILDEELEEKIEKKIFNKIKRKLDIGQKYLLIVKYNLFDYLSHELKEKIKLFFILLSFFKEKNYKKFYHVFILYEGFQKDLFDYLKSRNNIIEIQNDFDGVWITINIKQPNNIISDMMEIIDELSEVYLEF